jgi:hypothetical protein
MIAILLTIIRSHRRHHIWTIGKSRIGRPDRIKER